MIQCAPQLQQPFINKSYGSTSSRRALAAFNRYDLRALQCAYQKPKPSPVFAVLISGLNAAPDSLVTLLRRTVGLD
jgi:hypothetical protein